MKYIIVFNYPNGSSISCDAFPFDGRSAEESLVSCINYHIRQGYTVESISTAPLEGDEEPFDPDFC